jgi:hypothetical protein
VSISIRVQYLKVIKNVETTCGYTRAGTRFCDEMRSRGNL